MALDTKQKQGSAMLLTLPFRQWLAEPVASIGDGERLSLLRLCSDPLTVTVVITTPTARTFVPRLEDRTFVVELP